MSDGTAAPERRQGVTDGPPAVRGDADGVPLVAGPSPWKALLLGVLVAGSAAAVALTPLRDHLGPDSVREWREAMDELGIWGPLLFFVVDAVSVALGAPRLLFAALAGALFGWGAGAALSHFGGLAGAWLTFATGRALGREYVGAWVRRRMPRADRLLEFVGRHGLLATTLLRAAPVGHAFSTSLLMSLSPVRTAQFLLGTFLGSLPYSVVMALLGSAADGRQWEARIVGGGAALVAVTLLAGWWARRVVRRERAGDGSHPPPP